MHGARSTQAFENFLFLPNPLKNSKTSKTVTRIALGLSFSSYELMQRLISRGHVDLLALSPSSISNFEKPQKNLLFNPFYEVFEKFWQNDSVFICIGAIGAVIRLINPLITNKENDPAIIVVDYKAQNFVPILGGHKAGAEKIAQNLAEDFGGNAVLTGFSGVNNSISLDDFGTAWGWQRNSQTLSWNKLMIDYAKGEQITFLQNSGNSLWKNSKGALDKIFDHSQFRDSKKEPSFLICSNCVDCCAWHPPVLWVGIGCERNTSENLLRKALKAALKKSGLARKSIAGLASIDIKKNESALNLLVEQENLPIKFFRSKDLEKIIIPNPSDYVKKTVGTPSVAEAAAFLAAGEGAVLRLEKTIFSSQENDFGAVTIAIAESRNSFAPNRGELHLIGSGPGDLSFLTQDARFALSKSAVWVGYKRYLDLLEPLRKPNQVRVDSELTFERDRCQKALNLAIEGAKVALISSGDSGIYGMAGLALEYWLKLASNDRPHFKVHPGISAFQVAASKVGAPLMHDFCAISLSDCLTSWEIIETRLKAAAASDFVIALYNPKSEARPWQLQKALELLLEHRSVDTPVLLAHQLGRKTEEVSLHTLSDFPDNKVNMLSILLIGNSSSFVQNGLFLTPRGY